MRITPRRKLIFPAFAALVMGLMLTMVQPANSADSKSAATNAAPKWVLVNRDEFNMGKLYRDRWTPFHTVGNTQPDNTIWDSRQITFAQEGTKKFLRLKNSYLPDANGNMKLTSAGIGGWGWLGNATGTAKCGAAGYKPGSTSVCRKYGRYDVRLRLQQKLGVVGVGLLFPPNGVWPPEIDFFEVGYTTPSSQKMEISHHFVDTTKPNNHGKRTVGVYNDFTKWHTMSTRWGPNKLEVYVDGVLKYRTTANIPNMVMWPGLQNHFRMHDGFSLKPGESVNFDVDWVRVYRDDNIS